jgi:hypothetical protein
MVREVVSEAAEPVVFWFNVGNVQFVNVPEAGVPNAGEVNVGDVRVMPASVNAPLARVKSTAVVPMFTDGNLAEAIVPDEILDALRVVKFAPDTEPNEPDHVPVVIVPTPVMPVYEPDRRADGNVPEVMLLAFVVSVVADAAKPVINDDGILPAERVPTEVKLDVTIVAGNAVPDNWAAGYLPFSHNDVVEL